MNEQVQQNGAVPKLALNRIEAAAAIGLSPATLDRLAQRGLIRPCRATYRPIYWVKELERFLKENSAADYVFPQASANGLPGHRANKHGVSGHSRSHFPGASPPALGEQNNSTEKKQTNGEIKQ